MKKFRFAIAGVHIESGTLNPLVTELEDFLATRGAALMERYPFLTEGSPLYDEVQWIPIAHFRAMPGGVVNAEAYQAMKTEILRGLQSAGELDGFFFDIHGAMTVQGLQDAELGLLGAIREQVGSDLPISCSQDLHGNVSADLIEKLDYITAYRTAPHVDFMETRERAMQSLLKIAKENCRPARAWLGIPVLLSGEMTSTEVEPGKSLWSALEKHIDGRDVWDVSLWAGYPWADQKRATASVVVTGENEQRIQEVAKEIALNYWQARKKFQFLSPAHPPAEVFSGSLLSDLPAPVFLSDAGDNPTAGGAGDTTGVLAGLLGWAGGKGVSAIFASVPDREAVLACQEAGVGASVSLSVGGKLDPLHSSPLELTGIVTCCLARDDRFGAEVVVRVGDVSVILSEKRRPYHLREDFIGLGLDPLTAQITVVKIGYLEPELKAMAASHILLLSDGGVPPLIEKIEYQNIQRPMFPWDRDDFFCHKRPILFQPSV